MKFPFGRPARPVPSMRGLPAEADSNISTGSSAARRTNGIRRSMKAPRRSRSKKTPEEGYHLMEDMTDKAINWIGQQKALIPDKPFFVYFAPGATHAPHHVPKEWADKYKGKFDQGWDKLREETFARQKKLGVIPQDCQLTPRHKEIPAWDEMPAALKPVLIREMEVYAGFMEYTDHHVGRLVDSLKKLNLLDDTLIYYIIGDNGAFCSRVRYRARSMRRRPSTVPGHLKFVSSCWSGLTTR